MIGGATNIHTLQSGFVLSLYLERLPSLVMPHFESLAHHMTMTNKIGFGHKIPISLYIFLTDCKHSVICTEAQGDELK